ncbi:Transcriptional regulator, LuxR family [Altererythrobacter epoxidivorans]|uniref:Transcriptional regulator, LuxR family n=1 Tax=Altererythrobacter epoxidivorans TaxID=361183 RepID=A0A0M4M6E5_9SPHN|nr:response regulator transcription factor [Altererythrobacter epoxidivorans]ALE15823.1 Transcriptional regulator, LuxR family [Altererythrobacter epoxidivorans]
MARSILIADDHPLMRGAIRAAVEKVWPSHEVREVSDVASARTEMEAGNVELATLDLHMQDSNGLAALLELRKLCPAVPIVVISASGDSQTIAKARELGASGFIAKTASLSDMTHSLRQISEGELVFPETSQESDAAASRLASLTPAQTRILRYLSEGLLNKQIAYEMDISEATVKAHITAIFRRLGVTNRTQAVLVAKELDINEPTSGLDT